MATSLFGLKTAFPALARGLSHGAQSINVFLQRPNSDAMFTVQAHNAHNVAAIASQFFEFKTKEDQRVMQAFFSANHELAMTTMFPILSLKKDQSDWFQITLDGPWEDFFKGVTPPNCALETNYEESFRVRAKTNFGKNEHLLSSEDLREHRDRLIQALFTSNFNEALFSNLERQWFLQIQRQRQRSHSL